jgi:hypothetical protein
MDNNDEIMMQIFMQEEDDATAERQQRLPPMLTNLLSLRQHIHIVPRRGGSRAEKGQTRTRIGPF